MLALVNPIKEAEDNIKTEQILKNTFGFNNDEIQNMPTNIMHYLFLVLAKRKRKKKFEEMKRQNK